MDCVLINYTISLHTLVNGWPTHNFPGYSQYTLPPPPALLSFISYFVAAPCLCNKKITMTGTIREPKQNSTWSSAHQ